MRRDNFNRLIDSNNFQQLFIEEMGWNNPADSLDFDIEIDEQLYVFYPVADKNGFHVYTCEVETLPVSSLCKKIDNKLRTFGQDYLCVFILNGTSHHLWLAPIKNNEKRELVKTEYLDAAHAELLFSKVNDLSFGLTEHVLISDVKQRVQGAFQLNSEKITKEFYAAFNKEHSAFQKLIQGISDSKQCDWYASVMLNRLMFCYFIQKKGFLDGKTDYLVRKLKEVQKLRGEDQFFGTFYKGFLMSLFHDGLNSPRHASDFEQKYGRIPYLNGGMFDVHQLEKENQGIDIPDEAFERLFKFFDKWEWHLDSRLTASGKDINPDVLGYIFEQYINNRAQMGAYYTKEDITEYIGKNCILPFLMDKVAKTSSAKDFQPDGFVWKMLRESGDRYIYDAVKKGYTEDWQQRIPDYIKIGIEPTGGNLLERRSRWNEKTAEDFALPTEIWRETIERLQRCDKLIEWVCNPTSPSGDKRGASINDFITYNLDIRTFVEDLIRKTEDHLFVEHTYKALRSVTILDPTCGSGAFLFAALNILEPLYEACLDRMEEWNKQNPRLFNKELGEITNNYRSNRQYFIYKNIILRNLYGVDIMVEATEIAKLRLFLKMVAVVEVDKRADNMGLDPLPDIDFNIKCGNTLVGYPTEKELRNHILTGDFFAQKEFEDKIEDKMNVVAVAYSLFRSEQLRTYDDNASLKETKKQLKERLAELNNLLSRHLYKTITDGNYSYEAWLESHQPFHWIAEFYEIMHGNGGFDVIIGNPPYVEYNKKDAKTKKAVSDIYKLDGYNTISCGNLYAFVMERTKSILRKSSYAGMIVPLSGHSTERMAPLVSNFYNSFTSRYILNLSADAHPSKLFEGVKFRLCIFIVNNSVNGLFSTKYSRWYADERSLLFENLIRFHSESEYECGNIIPKISSPLLVSILNKIKEEKKQFFSNIGHEFCLYHDAPVNWMRSHSFIPYFRSDRDGEIVSRHLKKVYFDTKELAEAGSAIINSTLFFLWWITHSSCYNVNSPEINSFRLVPNERLINDLHKLNKDLTRDVLKKSCRRVYNYKSTGVVEYDEFYLKLSKPIIDEIDKALAKHYGFTEEELDFIINYDIKYRMGDELEKSDE